MSDTCSNCNRRVPEGVVCGDCDGTAELQAQLDSALAKLARYERVVEAARQWRIWRARHGCEAFEKRSIRLLGSEEEKALAQAIDALDAKEQG